MADTTALKNRIRAAIKANDNQEITGPVLQQSLLDIVDELNGATETEASQRQSGDSTLQQGINTERQARIDADNALGQRITDEENTRQLGDSILQQGINTERQARIDADNALGQRITDEINSINASNVTYNHNDSKLDATNVQQAVDEVRKRSNYNDGDNIIDFNTIHLITDNPEFVCVAVDVNDKILYGIKTDGQPYFGVGCPQQVKDYIDEQINKILGTDDISSTIDSLKEIEAFLKDFTNSDTLKALLDTKANKTDVDNAIANINADIANKYEQINTDVADKYKKSNPNDEEGNVVDTNTIVSVEDNPEYIKVLTDSVGKLIEAIGLDGVRKFFAGINIQGTLQCVTDNPEYIAVWLDNQNRIVFGFKINGDPYFGYGVPSQIKEYISIISTDAQVKLDSITQDLANTKEDIDKKINFGDNTYPSNVHEVSDNPEFISAIVDAVGHILEAYGVEGVKKLFTAIEVMGTLFKTEDNPEFISVELDKLGHILGGWKTDGDYYFGTGVPTQIQLNARDIYDELSTANAIEIDTDNEGNVYATTGINGNISVEADDGGNVFLIYDTNKIAIEDAYEDEDGTLIVEQNKVITL